MRKNPKPEILAPVGGEESLAAAVLCGADAVYLGVGQLNARRAAQNFDGEVLAKAVAYCHARGVKVYLTLNTMVLERERPLLAETLERACALGVDAIIAADLSAAALARAACPTLPLFASTQTAVTGPRGAALLRDLGFSRVVLARELTLPEIRAVTKSCGIETEVFVHGAHCMSISGQCYLSSVIGGRSGNRGLCAQPCRLPFGCGGQSHALSLKDLSLIDRLGDLAQAGVASLKIEGRMKRPEYVAGAVTACKKALDGQSFNPDELAALFSRAGFTAGYLDGKRDGAMFGTRRKEDVAGASPALLGRYAALYQKERGSVRVDFHLTLSPGQPAALTATDREGNTARALGEVPAPARTLPLDPQRAAAALSKTGGTLFCMGELACEIAPGLNLPGAALNALRRQVLEQLTRLRERPRPIPFSRAAADRLLNPSARGPAPARPRLRLRLSLAGQLSGLPPDCAADVSLPLDQLEKPEGAVLARYQGLLICELPRYEFGGEKDLPARLAAIRKAGVNRALAGSLGAIRLAEEAGMAICGDFSLNIANTLALEEYRALGLLDATLSFEPALTLLKKLGGGLPRGVLAYGHLPLMHLRNCPARAFGGCKGEENCARPLRDRMGKDFFLRCTGGEAALHNHLPLWIGDRQDELTGFDFYTLYFTKETPEQVAEVIRAFELGESREEATRGLYYRGVK